MNYEQALEASKCNPAEVNKVLEGLEWECDKCKGSGLVRAKDYPGGSFKSEATLTCWICGGAKKLHYSWTPQVGEWIITPTGEVWLFTHKKDDDFWMRNEKGEESYLTEWGMENQATPILEWEEIEEIIKEAGYGDELYDMTAEDEEYVYCIWTGDQDTPNFEGRGKSRQEAVMKAVLELGKGME